MNTRAVLYVEDEENDAFIVSHAWKKAGVVNALHVVTDGEQAIQYLRGQGPYGDREKHPMPCLVLLDLKIPKLNGFDVLKWIRESPSIQTLPVLILTSSNQPSDIHQAYSFRANAYLTKPSNSEGLAVLIASVKEFWLKHVEPPPACAQLED